MCCRVVVSRPTPTSAENGDTTAERRTASASVQSTPYFNVETELLFKMLITNISKLCLVVRLGCYAILSYRNTSDRRVDPSSVLL